MAGDYAAQIRRHIWQQTLQHLERLSELYEQRCERFVLAQHLTPTWPPVDSEHRTFTFRRRLPYALAPKEQS